MKDLKTHIDDTYWTVIKDGTKTAATDPEFQIQLLADIMFECQKLNFSLSEIENQEQVQRLDLLKWFPQQNDLSEDHPVHNRDGHQI